MTDNKEELEGVRQSLVSELDQLQHELRRVQDGLEKTGGVAPELEKQAEVLADNIDLCERELAENQGQIDWLKATDLG